MAYPPALPPATRTDSTIAAGNHAQDHNQLVAAITAILNELGASPSGSYADLSSRLLGVAAGQDSAAIAAFLEQTAAVTALVGEAIAARDLAVDISNIEVSDDVIDVALKTSGKAAKHIDTVSVTAYGATGDGVTDDTAAINAAMAVAVARNAILLFPPTANGYRTTDTIAIPGTISVDMQGMVLMDAIAGKTAITYNATGSLIPVNRIVNLWARRKTVADWLDEADRGILIRNAQRCDIIIREAYGFTIGVEFQGENAGLVYNNVALFHIYSNKYGVDLNTKGTGWCNENLFLGGQFAVQSTVNLSKSRYAIRVRSQATPTPYLNNSNTFLKPSFEISSGNLTGGAEAVPVLVESGILNKFLNVRNESNAPVLIRTSGSSQNNFLSVAYGPKGAGQNTVEDLGSFPTTVIERLAFQHLEAPARLVYSVTDLHKRACPYDATQTNVPGMILSSASNGTQLRQVSGLTIAANYLGTGSRTLGVMVDTRVVKRFVVGVDAETGYGGRFIIRCYDAAGNIMNPADYTAAPLVKGESGRTWVASTSYGGAYNTGSDSEEPAYFAVADSVASVWVAVGGGTQEARVSAFRLSTRDLRVPAVWTPFPENAVDPVATQAPASGTHPVGRRVWHGAPATGQPMGWVCTAAGTPGTWRPMPNLT